MAASEPRQDFLMSIRPQYVAKILAGQKTVELRCAKIKDVQRLTVAEIWKEHADAACISRRDFYNYFSGTKFGFAILLGAVKAMRNQLTACELESQFGIVPPQSYRYVTSPFISLLDDEPFQITHRHSHSNRAGRSKAGRSTTS
jgi:predicted transcriptional regulator